MHRAAVIITAMLVNSATAGPKRLYDRFSQQALFTWPKTCLRACESKLNRPQRSEKVLKMRGMLLAAAAILLSVAIGVLAQRLFAYRLGWLEGLLVTLWLPVRPIWDNAMQMSRAMRDKNRMLAEETLLGTLWPERMPQDEAGLCRAGVETLAVQWSENILAPSLAYLCFGLPGMFASKMAYAMKETLCSQREADDPFGRSMVKAHYFMHYIPARLGAVLWVMSLVFMPAHHPLKAARTLLSRTLQGKSPEQVSLLAAAVSLDLTLGGPVSAYASGQWLGQGTVKAQAADVKRAAWSYAVMVLLWMVMLGLCACWP